MNYRVFSAMDVGPREDQEDCILIQADVVQDRQFEESRNFSSDGVEIIAVCDGMGGLAAGEKASRFVCERLAQLQKAGGPIEDIRSDLEKIQLALEHDTREESGTTVAGLIAAPNGIQVFNLGDSRVYRVSDGRAECRSCDHSIVQTLLDEGKITDREAFEHPYRNLITAGMGSAFSYKWERATIRLRAEPFTGKKAAYLICSDGVCDVLTDREIGEVLGNSPVSSGPALMERVKTVFMKDNTSFIIVEIEP